MLARDVIVNGGEAGVRDRMPSQSRAVRFCAFCCVRPWSRWARVILWSLV